MQVLCTIMMVTYNRLDLTKITCQTTLNNTGLDYNLIIVDNNSEDDTIDWLKNVKNDNIKNIIVFRLKENKGICYGRNMGLKLYDENFSTKYLCTLDNDVQLPENWLVDCCEVLESIKFIGACGVNLEDKQYPKTNIKINNKNKCIQIKPKGNLGTACQVFSNEIHEKLGFFNSEYKIYAHEDADFGFRIRLLNKNLCYIENNGIHLGVADKDVGQYREMKNQYWNKNLPIFEKNVRLYSNRLKSIYCKFEDYNEV